MVPVSNEITMFNIDDNGNPTTPHEMKNTTLACSLCFIQEKTVYAILKHHHEDHLMKFLSEKKITLKNFFIISSANELYACEDNSERQNVLKIATLLQSPVKIYCDKCGKFPRNTQRAIDHLRIYHKVEKISNQQDVSLWVDCNFHLYAVKQGDCPVEIGRFQFENNEAIKRYLNICNIQKTVSIFDRGPCNNPCNKVFEKERDKKMHLYSFHECIICEEVFPKNHQQLKDHIKEFHNSRELGIFSML